MRLISGGLVKYGKQVDLCVNAIKMHIYTAVFIQREAEESERDRFSEKRRERKVERVCYKQQLKNGDKMMKNQMGKSAYNISID